MNIIFVCTGNTCRSPMAEYYLKSKNIDNLCVISRGFSGDDTANKNSIEVMSEIGIDISSHISKHITLNEINQADAIICMTESHKQMLLLYGTEENKVHVLGSGISDPYGFDINTYRECRDAICKSIDSLIANDFFSKIEITSATQSDIKDIANIENQSFSTPWSENAILESMNAGTKFYVARKNNLVVGYMGVSTVLDEGYVTNVAVLPKYRRLGIGNKILEHVTNDLKPNLSFISLEVRVSNTNAIALYEKFGFEHVGIRKRFYSNPIEDAIIMTKNFV